MLSIVQDNGNWYLLIDGKALLKSDQFEMIYVQLLAEMLGE